MSASSQTDSAAAAPSSPRPGRFRWLMIRLTALALALVVSVVLVELTLRVVKERGRFQPYVPLTATAAYPTKEITPGVEGTATFTVNSFGCRGPEPAGERMRMLTIGGSTTACTILDDAESWPAVAMERVNARAGKGTLWVTNSGIDGKRSCHHVAHMRHLVPKIPNLDVVLVYCGLNEVGTWLFDGNYKFDRLDSGEGYANVVGESFRISDYADPEAPWYKRTEIWKTAVVIKARQKSRQRLAARDSGFILEDDRLEWLQAVQKHRQKADKEFVPKAKMETFPLLLAEYERNLRTMARLARESNRRLVLMSQAIIWQGISEERQKRLWMGGMDHGKSFVREDQMEELVGRANATMREVATSEGVLFLDLAAQCAGHPEYFYDGCHFTELGARATGEIVADFLLANVVAGAKGR